MLRIGVGSHFLSDAACNDALQSPSKRNTELAVLYWLADMAQTGWPIKFKLGQGLSPLGLAQRAVVIAVRLLRLDRLVQRSLLDYRLSTVCVPLDADLISEHGCRILHLSDLHLDGVPDSGARLCAELGSLACDLCVITGDFVDPSVGDLLEVERRLNRLLASLKAPYGVFAVLGDHDPDGLVHVLRRVGVQLVKGAEARVDYRGTTLRLMGVGTQSWVRPPDAAASRGALLFLAHSPDSVNEALRNGADYYLCGHTHGGQVCLPNGRPIVTRSKMGYQLASGAWVYQSLRGYTSRGIGVCGLSPRLFCPPEITVHVLTSTVRHIDS